MESPMPARLPEPTVAEVLTWMRQMPSFSLSDSIRDIEYAVSEITDEMRLGGLALARPEARR